jgi:energy-converting hydrogenase Eha subunit A
MLGRLLIGIVKGLLVGGLIGFGLAKLGFAAPMAIIAYLAAAVTGVLIGLVAGKPIWAKDAKIEAGMKAFVGALLGAGLMYAARRWLTMPLPIALGPLSAANTSLGEVATSTGTVGGLAVTSLAAIAALLGGFYEVDNDPSEGSSTPDASGKRAPASNKRIAADDVGDEADDDAEAEADPKRSKK